MISYLQNEQGFIYALSEWNVVDNEGVGKTNGAYLYIAELWIHKDYGHKGTLQAMIQEINKNEKSHITYWVYWLNQKHNYRPSKCILKSRLLKMGETTDGK